MKREDSPQPYARGSALAGRKQLNIVSNLFIQITRPVGCGHIGATRVRKGVKDPRRNQTGKTVQLRTPLICGNRRKGLRDFKNIRTQARVLVPAALSQRPQTVRERRVYRPGWSVAPEHGLQDRPIRFLATERNLTGEYL